MAFSANLLAADRLVLSHLGEPVRYVPLPMYGDPKDVVGVFHAAYQRADLGEVGVMATVPAVWFVRADLPTDPEGDDEPTIERKGTTYRVREVKPDGDNGVWFMLAEVE